MPERSIAVFLCRESVRDAERALAALLDACEEAGGQSAVHLLINGNAALAAELGQRLEGLAEAAAARGARVRAWRQSQADKALAWNGYVHHVSEAAAVEHFVDGYACVHRDAIRLLEAALARAPAALAATGVPTVGPSARSLRAAMLREGGLHGNYHALRGEVLARMRAAGIRLPVGLYRVDGVVGALLCFALDPAREGWDSTRICVVGEASWALSRRPRWHPAELTVMLRRRLRQAQGRLENAAVHEHLAQALRPPALLPETVEQLVGDWAQAHPQACRSLLRRDPLCRLALARLSTARQVAPGGGAPRPQEIHT